MPQRNVIQAQFPRAFVGQAPARTLTPHPTSSATMTSRPVMAQAKLIGVSSRQPMKTPNRQLAAAQPKTMQLAGGGHAFEVPASLNLGSPSAGQPLPAPVQQKMESFFGASFADVRVHVGQQAPSIGALAFTHGSNLYFAPGQYNPNSLQGQQLLGHELTHVLQQRAGRVRNPLGTGVAVVQDHAMEAEADRMGLRAAAHSMFP